MIMTASRLRSMGWLATLAVCAALVLALAFRVNALRSQVHQSDAQIIALKQDMVYLETEFETRASQQQLKQLNDVDFGYAAPVAGQYLDSERRLAAFAKPAEPGAPAPVRVASADDSVTAGEAFPAMVSPITGKPLGEAAVERDDASPARVVPAKAEAAISGAAALGLATPHKARGAAKPAHAKTASAPQHSAAAGKTAARHAVRDRVALHATPLRLALKDTRATR